MVQTLSTRSVMYVTLFVVAVLAVLVLVRPHSVSHPVARPKVILGLKIASTPSAVGAHQVASSSNAAAGLQVRSTPTPSAPLQARSTPSAPNPQVKSSPNGATDLRVLSTPTPAGVLTTSSPNGAADLEVRSAHPDLPPGVLYATPTDPVQIQSVTFSPDHVHAGDVASARILTTSNAAALTARIGTYQVNVPKVAPGTFTLSITVPSLLPTHQFQIVVTAIRADGATAQRVVPVMSTTNEASESDCSCRRRWWGWRKRRRCDLLGPLFLQFDRQHS